VTVLGLTKLVRDLERTEGFGRRLQREPEAVLSEYAISPVERDAVLRLDAAALVELGLNPLVMRNLLFLLGVPNADLYTHSLSLGRDRRKDDR
jgi:hypothetical protein